MRIASIASSIAVATAAAALGGCYTYPAYPPAPVARLTPEQSAALASRPIDPATKERYAQAEQNVQQNDQADLNVQRTVPYTYAYPAAPYYDYPYYGVYGGYPYYGGFYPFYPALSFSFGYRGGYGYRGYRGGYRGGYGGGFHGGGGFRGHR